MTKIFRYLLPLSLLLTGIWSCVNQDFDEPPVAGLPNLQGNITIANLKKLNTIGANDKQITDSLFIEGVVTADDESGNWYKQIVIEDETGGIVVRLNSVGLYNTYPIGRKVYVNLQGLWLGDYFGLPQINGAPDTAIAELLIPEHLYAGARDQQVTPRPVSIGDFNADLVGSLIQLDDVQFVVEDTSRTYADAVNRFSENRTLEDCFGNRTIIRTSGYADFASFNVPNGKGSVVATLSVYQGDYQLVIRDENDVKMEGSRCEGGAGGELMTIAELRSLYNGVVISGPDNKKIRGVVISDKDSGNTTGRNMVIQDASGGIVVRFSSNHNYSLGEEVDVSVSGQEISEFNGLLQVNNLGLDKAVSRGAGTLPSPRMATVSEILSNLEAWESTLVQVSDATISGGATFSGTKTLTDASGNIDLFTSTSASFASAPVPAGTVAVTAIVSQYNSPQLLIRNLADINGGDPVDPDLISLAEVRSFFQGATTVVPAGKKIRGIVISDLDSGNITGRNLVIQDAEGGIVIRFAANHNFALGEELEINISGQELSEYSGLLQVNNVPNANATSFGPGALPAPREATIQEIIDNLAAWESTLVKVVGVTFPNGGTYSGTQPIQDSTGSIDLYTRTQATFAGDAVPAGSVTLTALVSQFNTPQLNIRNLNDIGQ